MRGYDTDEIERSKERIKGYYRVVAEREWNRLEKLPMGRLEFAVNMHFIEMFLPPRAQILDIGGGPGRYTIALAKAGHKVTLADISPDLLEIARREIGKAAIQSNVEAILEADAQDLSRFADESFDAVLALGPFYHLITPEGRERAARETWRILVPGGLLFAAWIPRPSVLRELITTREFTPNTEHLLASIERNGVAVENVQVRGRMTDVYCADPAEIKPFFEERGFESLILLASEGMFAEAADRIEEMRTNDPRHFVRLWELLLKTAAEPAILGCGSHLLYVGRKVEKGKV